MCEHLLWPEVCQTRQVTSLCRMPLEKSLSDYKLIEDKIYRNTIYALGRS
jgi:hypothetical protein